MTPRRPLLEALAGMLTPNDVLVSCLGANARYLPHLTVPAPVFALCDSTSRANALPATPSGKAGSSGPTSRA